MDALGTPGGLAAAAVTIVVLIVLWRVMGKGAGGGKSKIDELVAKGRHGEAARLAMEEGQLGRAFGLYIRAQEPENAAAVAVRRGDLILLDDGRIQLRVEEAGGDEIRTRVVDGGFLGEHKGINAPSVLLPPAALTPKDVEDLKFGVDAGVDFVALSFVRRALDLRAAREVLAEAGAPDLPVIAKLERAEAVSALD
jgi:pyruvate kinase